MNNTSDRRNLDPHCFEKSQARHDRNNHDYKKLAPGSCRVCDITRAYNVNMDRIDARRERQGLPQRPRVKD